MSDGWSFIGRRIGAYEVVSLLGAGLIVELMTASWLDAFHDDARYQALVQRIGFPKP